MKWLLSLSLITASFALHADEMSVDSIVQEELEQATEEKSDLIFFFNEGDALPFSLQISGDTLVYEAPEEHGTLKAKRPFYMKVEDEGVFFSLNQENWMELTEFFTGKIGFSLGAEKNEPSAAFQVHLDVRETKQACCDDN